MGSGQKNAQSRGCGRIVRLSLCAVLLCISVEILFFTVMSFLLQSNLTQRFQTHLLQFEQRNEQPGTVTRVSHSTRADTGPVELDAVATEKSTQQRQILDTNDLLLPVFVHQKLLPSRDHLTPIRALKEWAGPDDVIVLAFVDDGVLDMAYSLIETSLLKHSIHNVLFVSSSDSTCTSLEAHGFPCILFQPMRSANRYSKFDSKDFVEKMKRRSFFIIHALSNGYNVLLTDVDVVYLKNPFTYLHTLQDFDIAPLEDKSGTLNAGFLYINATRSSIELYKRMNRLASHNPTLGEQVRFNLAVKKMQSDFTNSSLRVSALPSKMFQSGWTFWEVGQRAFFTDNPCRECVVIHDNFVIGHEAKVWRLKEMRLWMYDANKYYSCTDCKYLQYYNPLWFGTGRETTRNEIIALRTALLIGVLLKRCVIMPKFHGSSERHLVSLQNVIKIDALHRQLLDIIRENSFLTHPKVADSVRTSMRKEIQLETLGESQGTKNNTSVSTLPEYANGLTLKHVAVFRSAQDTILSFTSLYSINTELLQSDVAVELVESINANVVPYINV